MIAVAESRSEHLIGKVIRSHALSRVNESKVIADEVTDVSSVIGMGVSATVGSYNVSIGNRAWMAKNNVSMYDYLPCFARWISFFSFSRHCSSSSIQKEWSSREGQGRMGKIFRLELDQGVLTICNAVVCVGLNGCVVGLICLGDSVRVT